MPTPSLPNAHALVIGIANYERVRPLPQVVLDNARALHAALIDPHLCAHPPEQVTLLLDATGAALRQALDKMAAATDADSVVIIYFTGHGGRVRAGAHEGEYLLPVDADVETEQALAESAIAGEEFAERLRAIRASKVIVIFDCCHAGGIGQPMAASPSVPAAFSEGYYERLQAGRGRVILASSRSSEYSWLLPQDAHSLFTKHLLAALHGGIVSEDGLIRIFDLFEYIQPRVTGEHSRQHPIFKAEIEENFPVALYLGGREGMPAAATDGFRYDAYISYVDEGPDAAWVWEKLVPMLEAAKLKIAVSGDVEEAGVARVVNIERGIRQSKRTILVLSPAYLANHLAHFENTLAQTMDVQEGSYRLLPVEIEPVEDSQLPTRLSMLTRLPLTHPQRAARAQQRLIDALKQPLPRRDNL